MRWTLELAPIFVAQGATFAVERAALSSLEHAVHHLVAIEARELLRPVQVANVIVELLGALGEVGEVAVGQRDVLLPANLLRAANVVIADPVADAARAGVQREPDGVVFVETNLDEMIAAAERAERELPVASKFGVVARRCRARPLQFGDARLGGIGDLAIVAAGGHGDAPLDAFAERVQAPGDRRGASDVSSAIMPQPISTPTAAGTIGALAWRSPCRPWRPCRSGSRASPRPT